MASKHLIFNVEKLRERSEEINPLLTKSTLFELHAKLNKYKDMVALSAPQIGIQERVFCIKFNDGEIRDFINPVILKREEGVHLVREKDPSFPNKEFIFPRPGKIIIQFQDEEAKFHQNKLEGVVAEVFDRMQNYLDGIPLCDYSLDVKDGFDDLNDEEKAEVIDMYIKSLQIFAQNLKAETEQDEDYQQLSKAIEFDAAVINKEVILKEMDEVDRGPKTEGA